MQNSAEELHDIYRALQQGADNRASLENLLSEMGQKIRFYRVLSASFALFSALLLLFFSALPRPNRLAPPPQRVVKPPTAHHNLPQYTLPPEELWVMAYHPSFKDQIVTGDPNAKPVSDRWVKNAAYHLIVGQQALSAGDNSKAVIHLSRALKIFPQMNDVRGILGTAHLRLQDFTKAADLLKGATEEEETLSGISNLGVAYLELQQTEEAEKHFLRALEMSPEHPGCHKNLALFYQEKGLAPKALRHYESYFSLHQGDVPSIERYTNYLIELGNKEKAVAFLQCACKPDRADSAPLYLLLAKVEAHATNTVSAIHALTKLSSCLSPHMALTKLNQQDFDTIRDTQAFMDLRKQIEIASVTHKNQP